MKEHFLALHIETASSIRHDTVRRIDLVAFEGHRALWEWSTRVHSEDQLTKDGELRYSGAPLPDVLIAVADSIRDCVVVCHSAFAWRALHKAYQRCAMSAPLTHWLDSLEIAQLTWPAFQDYSLDAICSALRIAFTPGEPQGEAKAIGAIVGRAIGCTGGSIANLVHRGILVPEAHPSGAQLRRKAGHLVLMPGRSDGPLAGSVVVFTGSFHLHRDELFRMATDLGLDVETTISNRRPSFVIVGRTDPEGLPRDAFISEKHRQAMEAIAAGWRVKIISEAQFVEMARRARARSTVAAQ